MTDFSKKYFGKKINDSLLMNLAPHREVVDVARSIFRRSIGTIYEGKLSIDYINILSRNFSSCILMIL